MEGTPTGINIEEVRKSLMSVEGVLDVHDLHIWTITSGFPALSCHVVVEKKVDRDEILIQLQAWLKNNHQIEHCTFQIEGQIIQENNPHDTCN
jgi:cobalt-zinc-cadmium efflux system protein